MRILKKKHRFFLESYFGKNFKFRNVKLIVMAFYAGKAETCSLALDFLTMDAYSQALTAVLLAVYY